VTDNPSPPGDRPKYAAGDPRNPAREPIDRVAGLRAILEEMREMFKP